MLIETKELTKWVYKLKTDYLSAAVRSNSSRVKSSLENRVSLLDDFFILLSKLEKENTPMTEKSLEDVFGAPVKLNEVKTSRSAIAPLIIQAAKRLTPGEMLPVKDQSINKTSFTNCVYMLKQEGLVPADVRPLRIKKELYLYREEKEESQRKSESRVTSEIK